MAPRILLALLVAAAAACGTPQGRIAGNVAPIPDAQMRSAVISLADPAQVKGAALSEIRKLRGKYPDPAWPAAKATDADFDGVFAAIAAEPIGAPKLTDPLSPFRSAFLLAEPATERSERYHGYDTRFDDEDSPIGLLDIHVLVHRDMAFAFYFTDPTKTKTVFPRPRQAQWMILFPSKILFDRSNP